MNALHGRSMHVLTLTPFYPSDNDDAGGCFVAEPIQALANLGITHTVLAVQPFYRGKRRVRPSPVSTQWLRYFSLPSALGLPTAGAFLFARIVGRIRGSQSSQPTDLIHAHGPLPCGHAAMLLSQELGIPYVVSVHGLDVFSTEQTGGRTAQWCRRISQRVYRSSQRVICISERVREQVLEGTRQACRTSVVYNGVNPELFSPGGEIPPSQMKILSVGNLIPIKGHDLLLRSVAALVGEFPTLSLDIIGEGPERARLESLTGELQIRDRVHFLGHCSRREVATAMQQCTLFALPSRYEGLGCVYLEAMSTGKAAIGCRGQGIAEVIRQGSNGFLVGPDNERELTLALGMLLRDETRRKNIGRAARDTILERFTLAEQAEHFARIYRECVQ
ncbi:MAG TPA: glycosyltransferase [Verrucomicrobiae bacterium]|nr:glycosyltransferase [Verrucomicrobiae bacterium]